MIRHITTHDIDGLGLTSAKCFEWVREDFLLKSRSELPAKTSVHPQGRDFITTMPCLLPEEYHRFGVKIVSRINGNHPPLKSDLMLYDSHTGELLAMVDADRITTLRTAAVATLAIDTFRRPGSSTYSFTGLGNTGRATLKALLDRIQDENPSVRLFRYKDHAEKTISDYAPMYPTVTFSVSETMESLVEGADVVVSCITDADGLLVDSPDRFSPGCLLVPVHTRGFQNCDTVFDKVFADDTAHVCNFRYFNQFKQYGEISDVISGKIHGRTSPHERIISYNIGLGLHDVYFASKIYDLLTT